MQSHPTRLMILVAGPYRSGTGVPRPSWQRTWPRWRRSRFPSSGGEWLGLPLAALAGSVRIGDAAFGEVFHPIAERLLERCDAVLRVGGPSEGQIGWSLRRGLGG